jgi:serine phosphatase RsbU (regulator of sigma subunit)
MAEIAGLELELQAGVAKAPKYATEESGDTLEMVERPHGGLSLVLVDGQRSGRAAKLISNLAARKAISLLAEGVRDGAAARAAHDYLRSHRRGKVSAELTIVSVDLVSRTLVVSRNSHCPVLMVDSNGLTLLDSPSQPIGVHEGTKPVIAEVPLKEGLWAVAFTDGVLQAGVRFGRHLDVTAMVAAFAQGRLGDAQALADSVLSRAIDLDVGRPQDDMSVLVVAVLPLARGDGVRRLSLRFPLPSY